MHSVRLTIPLLIRLLEFAREDAKNDMALHFIAERIAEQGEDSAVSMRHYGAIVQDSAADTV